MSTKKNSILTETPDGTFYTGPLEPAKRLLLLEHNYQITVSRNPETGQWSVVEHYPSDDPANYNAWGCGPTEEEAWRYLIGSDFGPLDETYETEGYEAHQRTMLGLDPSN